MKRLLFGIILLSLLIGSASATLTGYNYYQIHNLTGNAGWAGNQANYPYYVDINSSTGTSTTGSSVCYLNGHSLSFPYDVNFTQGDGSTVIPSKMEEATGTSTQVRYWFNNTTIYKTGNTSIYIYYGKSAVNLNSNNGSAVFPAYDDYSYASIYPQLIYHEANSSLRVAESTIAELPNGSLISAFVSRTDIPLHNTGKIMDCLSTPGNGYLWSVPVTLEDTIGLNENCPKFLVNGTNIYLFYSVTDTEQAETSANGTIYYIKSTDNSSTWGSPVSIYNSIEGKYNEKPIILANGRAIVPFYYANASIYSVAILYSDDFITGGNTWVRVNISSSRSLAEPTVAQQSDGNITMLIRDQGGSGYLYKSLSADNGATWSAPAASPITSPQSLPTELKLSDGNVSLLWNNVSSATEFPRTTLTFGITNGTVVSRSNNIETTADYSYSNGDLAQASDGRIIISSIADLNSTGHYDRDLYFFVLPSENGYLYSTKAYGDLWTTGSGTIAYSDGALTGVTMSSKSTWGTGYAVIGYVKNPNAYSAAKYVLTWGNDVSLSSSWITYRSLVADHKWQKEKYPTIVTTALATADGNYHQFNIGQISTTSYFTRDGTDDGTLTSGPTTAIKVVDYQTDNYWQWVAVRPFISPEPAQGDWQAEQATIITPVANFTVNQTTGTSPLSVQFTDTSTNTPTSWLYQFGDGNTSTLQNPTHSYYTGNWLANLTATNSAGSNLSANQWINVTSGVVAPVANFTENVSIGYPAFDVQFNDTSLNTPTSWNWSFGDGQYSTTQNATHTYQSWIGNGSASYNVSLNATNSAGSNVSANQTKMAYPLTSVFTSNRSSGKPPLAIQFNTTYGNGTATTWAWDFGDTGTSTDQNATHVYLTAGTYTVTLNVSNAYSYNWSQNASMITVNPLTPPVANFTSNTTSGTLPKTIQFWDNSTNTPTSWQWSWGDLTANGTTANPQHTYTVAGTYTVILTATNADGSGSLQRTNYITIASGVIPFPGEVNTPTNPLGGTLYWDVNGNGRIDYNDLYLFFNYLAWAQANEPTWAFDFNSNGRLDYNDVQLLFGRL